MLARIRKAAEEREGGFTLIELLVVIIIIGILAAIAIPVFLNQRQKGYDAQAKSDARNLATLEETYLTDNDHYKTEASATTAATTAKADLGYKPSSNVTNVAISTYDAAGAAATDGVGSYCIDVTSSSTKHFIYNSKSGGLVANATACPATN
jgi:type IV pilus assembly protein PilA